MRMTVTGKYIPVDYEGIHFTLCNQRCRDWDHPYEWQHNGDTLSSAGCGIFSVYHAAQYLGGQPVSPEELADFACRYGGRGDDGTDRPELLSAMQRHGWAAQYGFSYQFDGLRNDLPTLYDHLAQGNAALCNLRPGHIVTLIGAREMDGEQQVLALDSYSESADPRVRDAARQCVPGSEVTAYIRNKNDLICGTQTACAVFWVDIATVRDFNLLHRLR